MADSSSHPEEPIVLRAIRRSVAVLALALPSSPAVSADGGSLLVLNKSDNTIDFVDSETLKSEATLPTGAGPHEIAVSPDGRTAVVANYGAQTPGNTLSVYDLAQRKLLRVIDLGEYRRPHGIQYEDASHVLVTVEQNQAVIRVNVENAAVEQEMKPPYRDCNEQRTIRRLSDCAVRRPVALWLRGGHPLAGLSDSPVGPTVGNTGRDASS